MSTNLHIPPNHGLCPVCQGSGRIPCPEHLRELPIAGLDRETDTLPCRNCGGQRMSSAPLGYAPLDRNGQPCTHAYEQVSSSSSGTYHIYACPRCGDTYDIDSGD